MKVTVFSAKPFEQDYYHQADDRGLQLQFESAPLSVATAALATGSQAISIFTNDDASAPVLDLLQQLGVQSIAIRAAGFNNIDCEHAKKLGLRVANVPAYSPYAVAEHTVAMILALNRKLIQADRQIRAYNFELDELIGFDLHGKRVGIIGLGQIGAIVAQIMHGFGCTILGSDPVVNATLQTRFGVEYMSVEELCSQADIITLHAPLNDHTQHLVNKNLIEQMKPGVMLINTGRGALLHTTEVMEALKTGKIGYLGMDVYEHEKDLFFYDHSQNIPLDDTFARLLSFKNVLITGHQGFLTKTALQNITDTTLYNLACWNQQQASENELFPQAVPANLHIY
ncbi:MAG: 2-hydroxyacid dehydrogenase [Bacteroidota bacterium]